MSRTQPLRHRLFLTQGLVVLLLAAGVLGAALWGARRAVQALSRELVDRAALEVETHLDGLYEPAAEHLDSLAELARLGLVQPGGDGADLRRLALPWFDARTGIGAFGLFSDDGHGVALRRGATGWEALAIRPEGRPRPAATPTFPAPRGARSIRGSSPGGYRRRRWRRTRRCTGRTGWRAGWWSSGVSPCRGVSRPCRARGAWSWSSCCSTVCSRIWPRSKSRPERSPESSIPASG